MNLLKGSFFMKVATLIFAIFVYFYINGEIKNADKKISDPSYKLIKLTAKSLPLKLRAGTSAPEGYKILEDQVKLNPKSIIVIGPEALLEEMSSAETSTLDVSESTKTVVKEIPVESVAGIHLTGEPYLVQVTVPIVPTEAPKSEETATT